MRRLVYHLQPGIEVQGGACLPRKVGAKRIKVSGT